MVATSIRGYLQNGVLYPTTTVRGFMSRGALITSASLREYETAGGGQPPPDPTLGSLIYGVSGTPGNFATGYNAQVTNLHVLAGYHYDSSSTPSYSVIAGVPASHDMLYQTKAAGDAALQNLVDSFPNTRAGKVYLHWDNEIDRKVKNSNYTMAYWQGRCDSLFSKIAASGKTYIIPSVEIQYQALQQSNQNNPANWANLNNYLRTGIGAIFWSAYASMHDVGGHEVYVANPVVMPNTINAYMQDHPTLTWGTVSGWPIDAAHTNDTQSYINRRNWVASNTSTMLASTATYYLWFDLLYNGLDYLIEDDPTYLQPVWQDALTTVGQW